MQPVLILAKHFGGAMPVKSGEQPAPPVTAKETPAAPNTKAAFPTFRLEPRLAFAIT